jgi:hypothetical protein
LRRDQQAGLHALSWRGAHWGVLRDGADDGRHRAGGEARSRRGAPRKPGAARADAVRQRRASARGAASPTAASSAWDLPATASSRRTAPACSPPGACR